MSLTAGTECQGQISSTAAACPHCGHPLSAARKSGGLAPYNAEGHTKCGIAKAMSGRYIEAIASLDRAIERDPKYALAYRNRGFAKNELGSYTEAIAD